MLSNLGPGRCLLLDASLGTPFGRWLLAGFDEVGQVVLVESNLSVRKDNAGQFATVRKSQNLAGRQLKIIRRFGLGE